MSISVEVSELPACNFCPTSALYDFKTTDGRWAYGCEKHYKLHRSSSKLGTGLGQKLVVVGSSSDDSHCPICGHSTKVDKTTLCGFCRKLARSLSDGLLNGFTRDDLDEIIEELWSRHYIK